MARGEKRLMSDAAVCAQIPFHGSRIACDNRREAPRALRRSNHRESGFCFPASGSCRAAAWVVYINGAEIGENLGLGNAVRAAGEGPTPTKSLGRPRGVVAEVVAPTPTRYGVPKRRWLRDLCSGHTHTYTKWRTHILPDCVLDCRTKATY